MVCYRYERFVVALEEATKDKLPFLKEKSLKVSACGRVLGGHYERMGCLDR